MLMQVVGGADQWAEGENTFLPNTVIPMDMRRKKICDRRAGTQERVTVHLAVLNPHL